MKNVTILIFAIMFGTIISMPEIFVYSVLAADEESSSTKSSSSSTKDSDNTDDNESQPQAVKAHRNKDNLGSTHSKKPIEACKGISCRAGDVSNVNPGAAHDLDTIKDLPNKDHSKHKQNNGEANRPHYKDTNTLNDGHVKHSTDVGEFANNAKTTPIAQDLNTDSRDELLDKVSSAEELHNILVKFRNFMDYDISAITSATSSPSIGKVNTTPTRSYVVSYSWEPADKITKEKYSILMLKFTDPFGKIIRNKDINYSILINDSNSNIVFQKQGSTPTGVDLKVIDENTFPIGGFAFNPTMYNIKIDLNAVVDGKIISEHAFLPAVAVVSEKT